MLSRFARVGATLLCTAGLVGLLAGATATAKPQARSSVIGGAVADINQWNFTAAVLNVQTPTSAELCTGSVLSPTKVLTAAHCVGNPASMTVRTKSTSLFGSGELLGVASVAIAPGWTHGFESDLAVLTLKTPTTATPIPLASPDEDVAYTQPGAKLAVAGFGNRNPLAVRKPKYGLLTAANVSAKGCPAPPWAICDSGKRVGTVFRRINRRVKRRPVRRGVCQGDSGGPLVAYTPAGPRLIGVAEASLAPVSKLNPFYFVVCGLKGYPSIHTRVASYRDFILANL